MAGGFRLGGFAKTLNLTLNLPKPTKTTRKLLLDGGAIAGGFPETAPGWRCHSWSVSKVSFEHQTNPGGMPQPAIAAAAAAAAAATPNL